jgi:hypothetical protein
MKNRLRQTLPYILLLPGILYLLILISRADGENTRLYWEYAGRVLNHKITSNFPDWCHHRVGEPQPLSEATRGPRRLAPYTDFDCEYPGGAIMLFAAVGVLFDDYARYFLAFAALMAACQVMTALILLQLADGPRAASTCALCFSVWVVLVGRYCVNRFDGVVALTAAAAMLAWGRARPVLAAVLLGLGGSIKLWPALLVPVLAYARFGGRTNARRSARSSSLVCLAGALAFAAPHVLWISFGTALSDSMGYLRYMRDRPPEIESVEASLLVIREFARPGNLTINFDFASINAVADDWQTIAHVFMVGSALAYLAILAGLSRCRTDKHLLANVFGLVVVLTIASSKVFSGEYSIWLFPFCTLALAGGRWGAAAWYAAMLLFLRAAFYLLPVTSLLPLVLSLFVAKNVCFLAIGACFGWYYAAALSKSISSV